MRAALEALWGGTFPDPVTIRLPRGHLATFPLAERMREDGRARAGVIKDAGDDPDVTHGCLVRATVAPAPPGAGVVFRAGEGVGTVTRPGLPVPPGEPAINPVPRRMMREVVAELAARFGRPADVTVEIAVPGGEGLARRTWNPRLGIVGGLSILGTTGLVIPYSCSAWIHSIRQAVDVARAGGHTRIAAATGSTSERLLRRLGFAEMEIVEVGGFVGALLKHLARHPLPRLVLAGGFAKMTKLAQGRLDLHSRRHGVDLAALAVRARAAGAEAGLVTALAAAPTAKAALDIARRHGFPLGDLVAADAHAVVRRRLDPRVRVTVLVCDREGEAVGRAGEVRP